MTPHPPSQFRSFLPVVSPGRQAACAGMTGVLEKRGKPSLQMADHLLTFEVPRGAVTAAADPSGSGWCKTIEMAVGGG